MLNGELFVISPHPLCIHGSTCVVHKLYLEMTSPPELSFYFLLSQAKGRGILAWRCPSFPLVHPSVLSFLAITIKVANEGNFMKLTVSAQYIGIAIV